MGRKQPVSPPRSAAKCIKTYGKHDFAYGPAVCAIDGFGLFWLGIAHLPIFGQPPAHRELAGVSVSVGAVIHLVHMRRTCTRSLQSAHKSTLVRISPVM